jgi:Leucine-rich repeat (LRR) protein
MATARKGRGGIIKSHVTPTIDANSPPLSPLGSQPSSPITSPTKSKHRKENAAEAGKVVEPTWFHDLNFSKTYIVPKTSDALQEKKKSPVSRYKLQRSKPTSVHLVDDYKAIHKDKDCLKLTKINLSNYDNIGGSLDSLVVHFPNLTWLVINSPNVNGPFSPELTHSRLNRDKKSSFKWKETMEVLDLSGTRVDGEIDAIFTWKQLQLLNLKGTKVSGCVNPTSKMENLHTLILEGCSQINGSLTPFCRLHSLVWLGLKDCSGVKGEIPRDIQELKLLEILDLCGSGVQGEIPSQLSSLSKLKYLDISKTAITGSVPQSFVQLKELTWLMLADTSITGPYPESMRNLEKLELLDISNSQILIGIVD